MARRSNILNQLMVEIRGLTHNVQGINSAMTRQLRAGGGILGQMNHPYNFNNLTSVQFWSDVINRQDKVRMQALGINTNTQALAAAAGTGVNRAGFTNAVTNQLELLTTGLDSSLQATKELGLEMRVTGQSEAKLYQTMRQSQVLGGVTNRNIEELSSEMLKLGHTYNISTESLVQSMEAISKDTNVAALGRTAEFSKLNMQIAARFGAGADQLATSIESMYAAGQTFAQDAMVGATGIASKMGDSVEAFRAYVGTYSNKVGAFLNSFPVELQAKGLEIAKSIFGPQGVAAFLFEKNARQGERTPGGSENKFATLNTAMETLYTPIEQLASKLLPSLIDSIGVLTTSFIAAQGVSLAAQGIGAIRSMGGIAPAMAGLVAAIPEILPFLIGAGVIAGGIWLLIRLLSDNSDEQTKIEKERFDLERRKDFEERSRLAQETNTSKYMELQANAITESMNMIMYNGDLSRRLAAETDKKKIELSERLLAAIHKMDKQVPVSSPNNLMGRTK